MTQESDARLIDEPFVAYLPSLAVHLGSPLRAIILQALWFARNRVTGETRMPYEELTQRTGITDRTLRSHVKWLRENGHLSSRRSSRMDATQVWEVHLDGEVSVEVAESATSTDDPRESDDDHVAESATSDVAESATSSSKNKEPLIDSPDADASPFVDGEVAGFEGDLTSSSGGSKPDAMKVEPTIPLMAPRPFPLAEQDNLIAWFKVTNGDSWVAAWNSAVASPTNIHYDPQVHLAEYLIKCKDQNRQPRPDLWLKFFIEDRQTYAQRLVAEAQKVLDSSITPQEREERDNRSLPPANWGVPTTEGES